MLGRSQLCRRPAPVTVSRAGRRHSGALSRAVISLCRGAGLAFLRLGGGGIPVSEDDPVVRRTLTFLLSHGVRGGVSSGSGGYPGPPSITGPCNYRSGQRRGRCDPLVSAHTTGHASTRLTSGRRPCSGTVPGRSTAGDGSRLACRPMAALECRFVSLWAAGAGRSLCPAVSR